MKKAIVVVTGVKMSLARRRFESGQQVVYIEHEGKSYKMNAAAGVVRQLVKDYEVIYTAYSEADRPVVCGSFGLPEDRFRVVDLLDKSATDDFVKMVADRQRQTGLPVHLVHYGGASDTKVELPNQSLLAHTWDLRSEAITDLVANNCVSLINIIQAMKAHGIFERQEMAKIISISAAAAVRAIQMHGLDITQKGAGHGLLRTIALDLAPENIFVTEIMPGSTDSGFFDNDFTLNVSVEITKRLGYDRTPETYPVFTAEQIGDAVKYALDANCNVREIVLLPFGQFPHMGA